MTKLRDRKKTALLVVDMQKNVVANAHRRDEVIANIKKLVEKARTESAPVIWIQHSNEDMKENTDGWQYVTELERELSEPLIHKRHGDSFEDTQLESELDRLDVRGVVVVGAQTDACIRATIHGAFIRGYDTTLVSDAHTTEDLTSYGLPSPEELITFTNTYWTWQSGPGRKAAVVKAAEIKFDDKNH